MAASEHAEVERKYDVGLAGLPDLVGPGGIVAMGEPVVAELDAVYVDTTSLDLARHHMTLRRREGGADAGWHLKTPRIGDARTELRAPLSAAVDQVPDELVARVRDVIGDRSLVPVARIRTTRHDLALLGQDGQVLALLSDDLVTAERLVEPTPVRQWREWEVELVTGPPELLDEIERLVLAAGGTPSSAASKLARTLGDALPASPGEQPS